MSKITKNEAFVLNYLYAEEWTKPTDIGLARGKSYNNASSWACRICKKLVEKGYLERSKNGHYRFCY